MNARFYCQSPIEWLHESSADGSCPQATLADAEAHHLLHVMRAKIGDRVVVFDGTGREFTAEVTASTRRTIQLDLLDCHQIDRESLVALTLAVALPKGDRQRWLVEKCVELGVQRLVPLQTERTVAVLHSGGAERLRRFVIEASKQCGRNRLMEIAPTVSWYDCIADTSTPIRWFADPSGDTSIHQRAESMSPTDPVSVVVAVGPEGGLTDSERTIAGDAGWQSIHLGERILRIETAAIAVAARLIR